MKKGKTPEQNLEDIDKLYKKLEKEKEDHLIVDIPIKLTPPYHSKQTLRVDVRKEQKVVVQKVS